MRRPYLFPILMFAFVSASSAAPAGALEPLPESEVPRLPVGRPVAPSGVPLPRTATTAPSLGTAAILGPTQASSASDCTAWTASECAATPPALSSNGASGSCSDGAYIACCPTQAATCGPWLATLYSQTWDAGVPANGATFYLPSSMPSGNTTVSGISYSAGPTLALPTATGSTVIGNSLARFYSSAYVSPSPQARSQVLASARNAYGTVYGAPRYTGQTITSCDSYVWQKWAGYSQWEDAARAGVSDPVNAALNAFNQIGMTPPVRSDGRSFSYNATPFLYQYTTGATIPRNLFFSFVPTWLSATDPTQSAILSSIQKDQASPLVMSEDTNDLSWIQSCGGGMEGGCSAMGGLFPWYIASQVKNCVQNNGGGGGSSSGSKPMAVGITCTTSTQYSPMTPQQNQADDELFASEQVRLDAYASLLSQLADLRVSQVSLSQQIGVAQGASPQVVYPAISASLLGGTAAPPTSSPTPPFASYYFPTPLAKRAAALSYVNQAMALASPAVAVPASPSAKVAALETQLAAVQAQITTVQQQITQALENEWNAPSKGCLLGVEDGQNANSCDWSPWDFLQTYLGMFQVQRQQAYERCMADTGDQFPTTPEAPLLAAVAGFQNPVYQNPETLQAPYTPYQYTDTLDSFEGFLSDYEQRDAINAAYQAQLAAQSAEQLKQQAFMTATTSVPTEGTIGAGVSSASFGQSASEGFSWGGSYFGVAANYNTSWQVTLTGASTPSGTPGITNTGYVESATGTVNAQLEGTGTVFGNQFSVIDAWLQATSAPPASADCKPGQVYVGEDHFVVLGDALYTGPTGCFAGSQSLSASPIDQTISSPTYAAYIPVFGVPIRVAAGASITVGLNVGGEILPPGGSSNSNLTLSVSGGITPYAKASAFVQAGIDLAVVSAGVEVDLTLLEASVPTSASFSIQDINGVPTIVATGASFLDLDELDGAVYFYAGVDLVVWSDEAKFYLTGWNGPHQEVPLFFTSGSWPIDALGYRLLGLVNPADVQ